MRKLTDIFEKRTINIKNGEYKSDASAIWLFIVPDSITKTTNFIFIEDWRGFNREFSDSFEMPAAIWNDIQSMKADELKMLDYGWKCIKVK